MVPVPKFPSAAYIVGTPPPPIIIKGGGMWPSENWVTRGGVTKFFAGKGETAEKEGWCRNGGLPLFYYFTVKSHLLCVGGK